MDTFPFPSDAILGQSLSQPACALQLQIIAFIAPRRATSGPYGIGPERRVVLESMHRTGLCWQVPKAGILAIDNLAWSLLSAVD